MRTHRLQITYVGGPTILLDYDGVRFLTDPTFDSLEALQKSGPVTLHKLSGPALQAVELGTVDYVLLSHDHHSRLTHRLVWLQAARPVDITL
jgi:L-ascorbate metabolism protein UlaG (beta-lactamase superfamily)